MEQQKRQRLQRQKDIHTLYQRSTSDSLPDESSLVEIDVNNIISVSNNKSNFTKFSNKSSSTDSDQVGGRAGQPAAIHKRRPVLQRQQRQSSEDTEVSSLRGNVHFKEDPEYFEAVQKNARGHEQRSSEVITANAAGGAVGGGGGGSSSNTYVPAVVKNNMVSGGGGGGNDEIKISSNQLLQPNFKSTVTSSNFLQNRSQQGK